MQMLMVPREFRLGAFTYHIYLVRDLHLSGVGGFHYLRQREGLDPVLLIDDGATEFWREHYLCHELSHAIREVLGATVEDHETDEGATERLAHALHSIVIATARLDWAYIPIVHLGVCQRDDWYNDLIVDTDPVGQYREGEVV